MVAIKRLTAILIIIGGVYFGTIPKHTNQHINTVNTLVTNRVNILVDTFNSGSAMGKMEPKKTFAEYIKSNQLIKETDKSATSEANETHIVASRGQAETRELIGELEITAYSEYGPVASNGSPSGRGKVAVDPLYIRYGTKLIIEGYGEAIAADSGRLIKGITPGQAQWNPRLRKYERLANIDVWFSTEAEALKWGRRVVKVYRLE